MLRAIPLVLALATGGIAVATYVRDRDSLGQSIKEEMGAQVGSPVTELTLTKLTDGSHTGKATTADGSVYEMTVSPVVNGQFEWKAYATRATMERRIRDHFKAACNLDATAVTLRELFHRGFEGTATVANGDVYDVTIDPPSRSGRSEFHIVYGRPTVERMIRTGINEKNASKVKTLALEKRSPGHYAGTAVLADGAKLKVRTWADDKNFSWEAKPVE